MIESAVFPELGALLLCGGTGSTISDFSSVYNHAIVLLGHVSSCFIFVLQGKDMHSHLLVVAVVAVFCLARGDYARDGETCSQNRRGCKIDDGLCICGYGCITEYRYNSKTECYKDIRGRGADLCQRNPCKNGGSCSQTSHEPGFKCKCEGTGFHGQRCQYACPKPGAKLAGAFPYECILI